MGYYNQMHQLALWLYQILKFTVKIRVNLLSLVYNTFIFILQVMRPQKWYFEKGQEEATCKNIIDDLINDGWDCEVIRHRGSNKIRRIDCVLYRNKNANLMNKKGRRKTITR